MLWLGLLITTVYSYCERNCYVDCLREDTLNLCSEKCCEFENISFDNGKVYFFDGKSQIEVDLPEIYYPVPEIVSYVPKPRDTSDQTYVNPQETLPEKTFGSVCEGKCSRYCEKRGVTCFDRCMNKYCVAVDTPEATGYWWYILTTLVGLYIIKKVLTPKKYLNGYIKLE